MERLNKESYASSKGNRPTETNRSKTCFPAFARADRMRVANVPARNCRTAGVQAQPKLSIMVDYDGTWKGRHSAMCNAWQAKP
jgi:hypothetical protein